MQRISALMDTIQRGMHYDFCPSFNAYVYWLKRPIGWFALALTASLLLGVMVAPKALFGAVVIAAFILVGSLWPRIAMWGIRGSIAWDTKQCEEGEDVGVLLKLVNRWPWPVWGLVVETDHQVASRPEAPGAPIALCRISPMAESEFSWHCRPTSRGVFPTEKVRISTSFPFGLWTYAKDIEVTHPLTVWPATTKLVDLPNQPGKAMAIAGAMSPRTGHEGDWSGVRPFREGDSLRDVHWAQSARRETIVVCEREHSTRQHAVLWLDPQGDMSCETLDESEWLIRMVASLAKHLVHHSWSVQVWLNNQPHWVHPGRNGLDALMDRLAEYHWEDTRGNLASSLPIASMQGWFLGVSNTARFADCSLPFDRAGTETSWVLLESLSNRVSQSSWDSPFGMHSDRVLIVENDGDAATRFRAEWQRYCQHVGRSVCA